jgi:hypothetical protein
VESAKLQVTDWWWLRELRIEELVIALGLVKTPESEESTGSGNCCELGCCYGLVETMRFGNLVLELGLIMILMSSRWWFD